MEKRNGRLVDAAETRKELAEWRRLQQKNLSIKSNGEKAAEKERVISKDRESSWQVRQSRLYQKEKEQRRLSKAPDRTGERESR